MGSGGSYAKAVPPPYFDMTIKKKKVENKAMVNSNYYINNIIIIIQSINKINR